MKEETSANPRLAAWKPWLLLPMIGLLLLAATWAAWYKWRSIKPGASDDPRLTFATPYRNVRPDVHYVGDEACARCHADLAESYRHHPMGQSLGAVSGAPPVERYEAAARNPFDALGFHYLVERRGDRVFHQETRRDAQGRALAQAEGEVAFAVGSGTRGRSYLVNRDGFLFQSPISWFSQKGVWDLSPGYHGNHVHFERPIPASCLFCHSHEAKPVEHMVNRYHEPVFSGYTIGCERCHGPGELHVKRRERNSEVSGLDDTIVNPRRLEPALREAVCQQCHLQGERRIVRRGRGVFDYRPGLPMHLFWSVFVRPPEFTDNNKAVSHVEQMHVSRCFRESAGKLGCISCHDPHRLPEADERVGYYRTRCLNCHTDQACSLPVAARREKDNSCMECHMPKATTSNIAHTAATDHRIPRAVDVTARPSGPPRKLRQGEIPLIHFHRELVDAKDQGVSRDLGLALTELAGLQTAGPLAALAMPLLESALETEHDDVPAWEAKANALFVLRRDEEALAAFEKSLTHIPGREMSLIGAAAVATEMGRLDAAIAYWQRVIAVNPHRSEYHAKLARLHREKSDWQLAANACEAALRLNPTDVELRKVLVECYDKLGAKEQAAAERKRLQAWADGERKRK